MRQVLVPFLAGILLKDSFGNVRWLDFDSGSSSHASDWHLFEKALEYRARHIYIYGAALANTPLPPPVFP